MNTKDEMLYPGKGNSQRISKILIVFLLSFFWFLSGLNAQIYIRVIPAPPDYVRPAPPQPGYIWVDGDWVYNGRVYVWREGYWAAPRQGLVWRPGHWKQTGKGYKWIPGHWRR